MIASATQSFISKQDENAEKKGEGSHLNKSHVSMDTFRFPESI